MNFSTNTVELDLPTSDNKRFIKTYELFGPIVPDASSYNIFGTKMDLKLAKADGQSWPVFRRDDKWTGERIQIGKPGRVA